MFEAVKYLDDITMKGEALETQLQSLDLKNVFHIMWVYKNLIDIHKHSRTKFKELVDSLQGVKVNDFYPASVILQHLNHLVVRIYSIEHEDSELESLKRACGYQTEKGEEEIEELKEHIFYLCKPIVGRYTKEVVDIMAYVFEVDGNKDFDGLFELFEESKDILIELHLHKVRIYRKGKEKSREKEKIEKNELLEFKSEEINLTKDMEKLNLGGSIEDEKPFGDIENIHMAKAKELLLNFETPSLKFYIENLSLFLSLQYDEEIFKRFISYTTGGYKYICASKIFRLFTVDEKKLECLISSMEGAEKDVLKASGLRATPQTLKLYVNWCISSLQGISIALVSDFIDIAKIYIVFVRQYKSPAMAKLFVLLWNCDIKTVEEDVKLTLLESFSEIVEILLQGGETKDCPSSVLDSFKLINNFMDSQIDIKKAFERVIGEVSHSLPFKKVFVSHLETLKHFEQPLIEQLFDSFLLDFDLDWRYRLNVLEESFKYHKILEMDFNRVLNVFVTDKVFVVRTRAKEIQKITKNQ